ncbi:MAG: hypothetical protein ACREJC_11885 [Tepidisphaeraceae bacterium]
MRCITAFICLLLTCAVQSFAQKTSSSALISEALDKQYNLQLNSVLPQAMDRITRDTGVPIRATQDVWELLPWGQQTNINVKIENLTLREALEAITRKLGLTFVLKDEFVQIEPLPALSRLGRRSTVQELGALDLLSSNPMNLSTERPTVRQLIDAVDQRLIELKSPFAIESRPGDNVTPDQVVFVARNASMMDALEALVHETRATWYPWGKSVVIVPKEDQVRNQLSRAITVRYPGTDVAQVLTELSQKAGVAFEIEPGAIQRIAPEFRRIKLDLYDASITKALEAIAGFTGLGYIVNEKGVYIWNQTNSVATAARDPAVGLIQLDNGMQVLVPQSQVPADMQEYLRARTQRELKKIRQMMIEEGFKPTKPATQPATKPNEDL